MMDVDEEDHNYHHGSLKKDIFQITSGLENGLAGNNYRQPWTTATQGQVLIPHDHHYHPHHDAFMDFFPLENVNKASQMITTSGGNCLSTMTYPMDMPQDCNCQSTSPSHAMDGGGAIFPAGGAEPFIVRPDTVPLSEETADNQQQTSTVASKGSSTESEMCQDIGSSTHLLDGDPMSCTKNGRHKYPCHIKGHSHGVNGCPCEPFFVHWNWPAIRIGCFVICVSSLVAILCVVVGILISRPASCEPPRAWWQGSVMYEVFTASFLDSDGDGFGDFKGLSSRLDYIRRLRVSVLRLSSVFSALDYPLEYEHIIDFDNVDPHLGHMEDFERFVRDAHEEGFRVILDFNPAVTSDEHTWAAHWLLDRFGEYAYFYVTSNDSAGTNGVIDDDLQWDIDRKDPHRPFGSQFFLNWSHPQVQHEILRSIDLWLCKGVDGFYIKHLDRLKVADDQELYSILQSWRRLMDRYDDADGRGRVLMTSLDSIEFLRERDSKIIKPLLETFDLLDVHVRVEGGPANVTELLAQRVQEVQDWTNISSLPWFSWNLGDVESARLASRLDAPVDPLSALFVLMALPGSVSMFYGDEIGQRDAYDITSGEPYRTGQLGLMQWTSGPHANFTSASASPWIPVHPDHSDRNVENATDALETLAHLADVRSHVVSLAMDGTFKGNARRHKRWNYRLVHEDDEVLVLERYYPRRPRYAVVVNFAGSSVNRDLSSHWFEGNVIASTNRRTLSTAVNFRDLYLSAGEAVLLEVTS